MERELINFIILAIFAVILILFLKYSLTQFNNTFSQRLKENEDALNDLIKFSYDIHFNPPPSEIEIDNPYECTPTDLQPCLISDPFSCIGCKSLISSCTHFEKDTKYIDFEGNESIIPKNDNPDEGYCLTKTNASQKCNPYHGDLVLVQTELNSKESMLYCQCKNPGYIGSLELNGACDEAFICNGEIDDINKPLEEIQCKCEDSQINSNVNNTPVCLDSTIENFNNYDDIFYNGIRTLPKEYFAHNISSKFPGDRIRDPCMYCIFTGKLIENGIAVESKDGWQCALRNGSHGGMPIRRDLKNRILLGSEGPDAIVDASMKYIYVHGYLKNTTYEQMTIALEIKENKEIIKRMGVTDLDKKYAYINMDGHNLVFPGSFGAMLIGNSACTICDGADMVSSAFICKFTNTISAYRVPPGYLMYLKRVSDVPDIRAQTAPNCPPKQHSPLFNSKYKRWERIEGSNPHYSVKKVNKLAKYEIDDEFKFDGEYKYMFFKYDFLDGRGTFYGCPNWDMWNEWTQKLIPKN
ncbi:PIF-1 [Penaeus vannamei nudivirus]|nr:PIF-1 [Penaeus vannamei nucleopolyhedrovirus]